ncbi:MAG: SRPBCC domain-containing protein [Gemmatimonadales bacterium]|nr:SRPBCC domain-containing protein [Gemmatimonadales bacterium]
MTWVHESSTQLMASPERIYRALVDGGELRAWFAEHAEIVPSLGGSYRFWGRHTLGLPGPQDADQRILRLETDRALTFSWRLLGVPTEVSIALAAVPAEPSAPGPMTSVTLHHRGERPLGQPREKELIDDFWKLSFGNLGAHLTGAELLRPDFGDPSPEIRYSILIDAPPAVVFQALIDPASLNRWIAAAAVVEPRVGGRFEFGWKYQIDGRDVTGGPTRILELEPDRRLVVDWPDWRGDTTVRVQRLSFELEPVGPQTRVTLVHSGFERAADISDYPFGWGHFLSQLVLVATGQR